MPAGHFRPAATSRYLEELAGDAALRAKTIADGREIVLGMARCRVPVVAAVNGPAVGLGCSLVALSDIVYIAEDAYLADPHVQVGLVAADGGPLTWPLHISLLLAKEYALTGARISAARAVELGLANHVVADPVAEAMKAAKKILELPQQAVESTKRVLNVHLERAVLATIGLSLSRRRTSPSRPRTSARSSPSSTQARTDASPTAPSDTVPIDHQATPSLGRLMHRRTTRFWSSSVSAGWGCRSPAESELDGRSCSPTSTRQA